VLLTGARGNFTISWGPALEYYAILLKRMRLVKFYRELQLYSRNMGVGRSRVLPALGRKLVPSTGKTGNSIDTTNLISPEFARSTGVYAKLQEQGIDVTGNAFDAIGARQHQFENLSIASKNGSMSTNFSLAYALRERDPTCDPRVIEFCLSVPLEQYVQNGMDRALLRRSTKNYLPDKVRLNQRVRGVQGADWVHRMMPVWPQLANELEELCGDPAASRYLNVPFIRQALSEIGRTPKPEQAFSPSIRLLIRSIIVYRFLKKIS
jgi:asparagine synthase (glutamine-hydrolysing)